MITQEEFTNKKQYVLKWMGSNLVHPESDPISMELVTIQLEKLTIENADYLERIVFMKPKDAADVLSELDK